MRITLIILLFAFSMTAVKAECTTIEQLTKNTINPTTAVNSTTTVGQSFKSCRTGRLERITIDALLAGGVTTANTTLSIASGSTTSNASVVYTQPVTINASGEIEFILNEPLPLKNNQTYTFFFGGSGDAFDIVISSQLGDTYTDGELLVNGSTLNSFDLFFKLGLIESLTPIPTMSQWGTFIFALLLLNMSVFFIRQNEKELNAGY